MKIEQLRYMVEISKTGSINQAAANLYLSQPNLSMSIRTLEDEIGCALIRRTNRGVQLTSEGRAFVEYAESIIDQFDRLRTIGDSEETPGMACLSIANMFYRFVNLLAAELFNRHQEDPFRLLLHEYPRDGVINAVAEGYAEIGLINMLSCYKRDIMNQIQSKNLRFSHISTDDVAVSVGPKNPLYYQEENYVTVESLAQFPFVNYEDMDHYHYSDKAWLIGVRSTKGQIIVGTRKEMHEILEHTNAFAVISLNELHYKRFGYDKRIRRFRIKGCTLTHEFGWIMRNDHAPSPLAREFIEMLSSDIV